MEDLSGLRTPRARRPSLILRRGGNARHEGRSFVLWPIRPKELLVSSQFPSEPMAGPGVQDSPWASGLTVFAAAMMMIGGVWHALAGIAALVHDDIFVTTPEYIYSLDLTVWGWVQLLLGLLVAVAGFAILKGQIWARFVGIAIACLSLIASFLFMPLYPLWSISIIALDVFVIWALAVYRREAS